MLELLLASKAAGNTGVRNELISICDELLRQKEMNKEQFKKFNATYINMLVTQNRRFKKQYVIGGAGIFDCILKFLIRKFTSQAAKQVASSATKEVGKAALNVGKTMAVDVGKKLIERAMKPKTGNKIENIMAKYTDNRSKGSAIAIQELVKRLNGSGLKNIK